MNPELLYQIALTLIPQIGPVQAKLLLQHCNAEEIFHAKKSFLEKIEGIGTVRAASITAFRDFSRAEHEIKFIEKYNITTLFLSDAQYPKRLLNCYDSPILLYYKGIAELNQSKIISVIGTRSNTDYGKQVTDKLIKEISEQGILVLSGLAFGIDAIAHKAALKNGLTTVGILGHGLDQIYPPEHLGLAKDILMQNGGLLTEFRSNSKPDKHNFPSRNRIVAGMSDAVIVVETGIKGGSLITAELANGYNKDVFAIPGKTTDIKSEGCNYLIKNNKASLISGGDDLLEMMNWKPQTKSAHKKQRELFLEFTADEKIVVDILQQQEIIQIDQLYFKSGLSSSAMAAALLMLEMNGVVDSLPGKVYKISR